MSLPVLLWVAGVAVAVYGIWLIRTREQAQDDVLRGLHAALGEIVKQMEIRPAVVVKADTDLAEHDMADMRAYDPKIEALMSQGLPAEAIAEQLGRPVGEVMLMLSLQRLRS